MGTVPHASAARTSGTGPRPSSFVPTNVASQANAYTASTQNTASTSRTSATNASVGPREKPGRAALRWRMSGSANDAQMTARTTISAVHRFGPPSRIRRIVSRGLYRIVTRSLSDGERDPMTAFTREMPGEFSLAFGSVMRRLSVVLAQQVFAEVCAGTAPHTVDVIGV